MAKQTTGKVKVEFIFTAPEAQKVLLVGDFTGWQEAPLELKKAKDGVWKKTVPLPPGRYAYRLLVDGEWRDDPLCQTHEPNQYGGSNCVCVVNSSNGQPM